MARRPAATVIGGGIAGLASAASLARHGWQVTVLERAPAFGEVGAGLAVTRNGMAALDALGAGEAVRAAGYRVRTAGFKDCHGRWLLRLPYVAPERDATSWLCAVHRQRLHAALLDAACDAELVGGAEVVWVEPGEPEGRPATVAWRTPAGERTCDSDLVVAADGIRSTVRSQLFPRAHLEYTGATSWRAVAVTRNVVDDRFVAFWGPGSEFGALRVSDTEVYWYGYFRHPVGARFADELDAARDRFAGWPARVTGIVAATTADQLIRHDVYHLPAGLPAHVRGRVVMVGDAAHAAAPTMGQGAASAVEDGVCVGHLVAAPVTAGGALATALTGFDRARRPRCRQITRQSALMDRYGAGVPGGWRQSVRNALVRLVPSGLVVKAGGAVVRWRPPADAAPYPGDHESSLSFSYENVS
ncbi:MAG: FAD-dependent oxidoreductase [Streptosporangiales bacterium]